MNDPLWLGLRCPDRAHFNEASAGDLKPLPARPVTPRNDKGISGLSDNAHRSGGDGNCRQRGGVGIVWTASGHGLRKGNPTGGHSHTVDVDYDGARVSVDTGFIVYNELNYPDLTALFAHLGVQTRASEMSFSVSAGGGQFEWCGRGTRIIDMLDHVFAQRSNLASPSFLWMLREMARFNRQSRADRKAGKLAGLSLGDYFESHNYCRRLVRDYLIPMGGAIWSTPVDKMLEFPAENFVAFFDNHRLLHNERPVWRTVAGGSRNYVDKLTARFRGQLRLGAAVTVDRTQAEWRCHPR